MTRSKLLKMRAAPAYLTNADPRIDRDNLMIRDTVAMVANVEALGHGIQSDQRTLEMMLALSREKSRGIKMHFGHTGMSENAMGRHIAWAMNFRIQGDKLIHDIDFMPEASKSPAFGQDPIDYILDMAQFNPEDIGESVVIETDVVWTLADGTEVDGEAQRPENAMTELPVIRPTRFYFVDVVADPALTRDGLLASAMFAGTSSFYSDQAFQLIDEFRSEYDISLEDLPRKVTQVLGRYVQSRSREAGVDMANPRKKKFDDGAEEGLVTDVLSESAPAEDSAAPAAEPAPAAESTDVDEALATAKETESVLADEPETEPAAEGDLQAAMQRIAVLESKLTRYEGLDAKIEKVLELATLNARNNASLAREVQALKAEPLVTESLGGPRSLSMSAPPSPSTLRTPKHVNARLAEQKARPVPADTSDPALASLAASAARAGASNS